MGDPQVYEELVPCSDGQICGTAPYYRRPCICMVDPACSGKAQPYHWKYEVKVLGSNAQVWRQDPQARARGKVVLLGKLQYPLVGCHMQRKEEQQACF